MAYLIDREEAKKAVTAAVLERAARADANPLEAQLAVRAYSKALDDLPAVADPPAEKAETENARLRELVKRDAIERLSRLIEWLDADPDNGDLLIASLSAEQIRHIRAVLNGGDNG